MSRAFVGRIGTGGKARLVRSDAFFPVFAIRIGATLAFFRREAS